MRLEGVFDSAKMGSVVLGEGQLPKGDSKSLDQDYTARCYAGPSKSTSLGQNRSYSVKPSCARGQDFPKGCRKSSCCSFAPIRVNRSLPSRFSAGGSPSLMPKLRKIVGPVEDSMPVSRTPREPRERRRHRLIYAYTEAHRLSEGIPTNWQESPPLIANQRQLLCHTGSTMGVSGPGLERGSGASILMTRTGHIPWRGYCKEA